MPKIACLIDPTEHGNPELKEKIELANKHADLFFIGGSTNDDPEKVNSIIHDICESKLNAEIWIFPGSIHDIPLNPLAIQAVSKVLLPIPMNSQNQDLIFHTQAQNLTKLKQFTYSPTAYIVTSPNTSVGEKINARDLCTAEILNYTKLAKSCGFPYLYLEAGSGGKFHPQIIKDAHEIFKKSPSNIFIYGGGIDSHEKLEQTKEILQFYSHDILVIGNKFAEVFQDD